MSAGKPPGIKYKGISPSGPFRIIGGILRLARGRADGFGYFPDSPQGFLGSLAPLLAFPVAGSLLMLFGGEGNAALGDLFATICAVLAPAVLSHALAKLWLREAPWLRFITAFNWCQWIIPVAAMLILVIVTIAIHLGLSTNAGAVLAMLLLGGYGMWLHFFLARQGLDVSRARAVVLVIVVNFGTVLLVIVPRVLLMSAK
jgi:hypothetical protein